MPGGGAGIAKYTVLQFLGELFNQKSSKADVGGGVVSMLVVSSFFFFQQQAVNLTLACHITGLSFVVVAPM